MIDWESILVRYLDMLGKLEGTDFLNHAGAWFNDDEIKELERLSHLVGADRYKED